MGFVRKLLCRLGFHKRLQLIQSFGAAQHIGCPHCRREFGIHHGAQTVVAWDADLEEMYVFMGYDVVAARRAWLAR